MSDFDINFFKDGIREIVSKKKIFLEYLRRLKELILRN